MTACILCPVYHPSRDPLWPDLPPACGGCRTRLAADLVEVVDLFATLPAWLIPGATHGPKVSGSREPALPFDVGVVDLMLPARAGTIADPYGDQTGHPSVASVLDSWVRDWAGMRREHPPVPTVASLAGWLSVRLDWALATHPAVDEFADEIGALVRILRAANRQTRPRPVRCVGVPCPRCDWTALWRRPDSDEVECGNEDCRRVLTVAQYDQWVAALAAQARRAA